MKTLGLIIVLLLVGSIVCQDPATTTGPPRTRGRRRKGRFRRIMESVSQIMDEKLQTFEEKMAKDVPLSTTTRMKLTDHRVNKLGIEVQDVRNKLTKQSSSLQQSRQFFYNQRMTLNKLNEKVNIMESTIGNLTAVVEHLENRLSSQQIRPQVVDESLISLDVVQNMIYPKDCHDLGKRGGIRVEGDYYIHIQPVEGKAPFKAYCKMINNSGWTVFQRRQEGTENFYRTWNEYKHGFGELEKEFWLGNDRLHHLTSREPMTLRIEMEDWEGQKYYSQYDVFKIDDEDHLYTIHVSGYHGNAGDSLTSYWKSHDGQAFSTYDRDNDKRFYDNCAKNFHGAWWFNHYLDSHLNGKFYPKGKHQNFFQRDGILWSSIHVYSSLKNVAMMVKPYTDGQLRNEI